MVVNFETYFFLLFLINDNLQSMFLVLSKLFAASLQAIKVWRAFLKSPENFSGPKSFRGSFRVCFSGSEKRFSKRPIFSRDFRGCFRESITQGIARASIF